MDPKGSHRRSSFNGTVDELLKGHQTLQSRSIDSAGASLLGNTSSRFAINAALDQQRDQRVSSHNLSMGPYLNRASGSVYRVSEPSAHRMALASRFLVSSILSGQSLLEVPDTDNELQEETDVHGVHPSDSDEDSSIESKSEKVLNVTIANDDHSGTDNESNARVHFKDEGPETTKQSAATKGALQKSKLGVSDHIVAARSGSLNKEKQTSQKSEREYKIAKAAINRRSITFLISVADYWFF